MARPQRDPRPAARARSVPQPFPHSNLSGYFRCDPASRIGRPTSLADLRSQILAFARVKAVGVGHSWDGGQFCAGTGADSLGLVLTEFPEVLKLYTTKPADYDLAGCNPATALPFGGEKGEGPILVDPAARTVKVHAGVGTRMLIDFLAACPKKSAGDAGDAAPHGWALPAIPWYIDQTIGGAVATATHGSSFTHGSLSNQVVGVELMTAGGDLLAFSASDPDGGHLFRAARASVGRLGVIYSLTFTIVPQVAVERTKRRMTVEAMAAEVSAVQDAYNAVVSANGSPAQVTAALAPLDNTQFFFFAMANEAWRLDFRTLGKLEDAGARSAVALVAEGKAAAEEQGANLIADLGVLLSKAKVGTAGTTLFNLVAGKVDGEARQNATYLDKKGLGLVPTQPAGMVVAKFEPHLGVPDLGVAARTYGVALKIDAETKLRGGNAFLGGVFSQYPKSVSLPPNGLWVTDAFNTTFDAVMRAVQGTNMVPGVFGSRSAYPSQACPQSVSLADLNGYDQYEAAIPFARAGTCLTALAALLNGPDAARLGFRTSPLVRFVGADDAYISMTQGTPTMFVNLEDHRALSFFASERGWRKRGGWLRAPPSPARPSFHPYSHTLSPVASLSHSFHSLLQHRAGRRLPSRLGRVPKPGLLADHGLPGAWRRLRGAPALGEGRVADPAPRLGPGERDHGLPGHLVRFRVCGGGTGPGRQVQDGLAGLAVGRGAGDCRRPGDPGRVLWGGRLQRDRVQLHAPGADLIF